MNYWWAATSDLLECTEVLFDETPWIPEISRWHHRAPLLLPTSSNSAADKF